FSFFGGLPLALKFGINDALLGDGDFFMGLGVGFYLRTLGFYVIYKTIFFLGFLLAGFLIPFFFFRGVIGLYFTEIS
ncbi:hypothetical protein, partial [Stenotrophomonas maltophilia]|uniref:hypothetical protein n=1 Tax=Stenotrophomonas maltophilia TaxID=40324 RepID=UPI0034E2FE4C